MDSLRDKLLDIISGSIPETPENIKFCEEGFCEMLDEIMDAIVEHIIEEPSD